MKGETHGLRRLFEILGALEKVCRFRDHWFSEALRRVFANVIPFECCQLYGIQIGQPAARSKIQRRVILQAF